MNIDFENHINAASKNSGEVYWDTKMKILSHFSEDITGKEYYYIPISHIYSLHSIKNPNEDEYKIIGISIFFIDYLLNDFKFMFDFFKKKLSLREIITGLWDCIDNQLRLEIIDYYEELINYTNEHETKIPPSISATIFLDYIDHKSMTLQ
ncbi:MAG: hypothetical protein R3B60_02255 [Candidatus Paceibacterota bacterium]